jgi:site-specific recombinase
MTDRDMPDEAARANSLREQVIAFFQSDDGSDHDAVELADRFAAIAAAGNLPDRLDALVWTIEWTRVANTDAGMDVPPERSRLSKFVQVIESVRPACRSVQDTFVEILSETEGVNLFGDGGIPGDRGFLARLAERVMLRLLPQPSDEHDLSRLVSRLFSSRAAVAQLRTLPPEAFHRFVESLTALERPEMWKPLRAAFTDGFLLLATRIETLGLSAKLRARGRPATVANSPFYRIARISHALMDAWNAGADVSALSQSWQGQNAECRKEIGEITRRLESQGVSVDIVYGIEVLEVCLARLEAMVEIVESPQGTARSTAIHRLLADLVVAAFEDRSVRRLIRTYVRRLQRKFVARSGIAGEHYVARNLREYRRVWFAAAGGGLFTVITTAVHLNLTKSGLPLCVEGILAGLNYAVSLMLLHHFNLMLATRQPARTAATLATLLLSGDRNARLDRLVEFTVRVCSSQFAAAVANVTCVFLGAFVFSYLWHLALGRDYLGVKEAQQVFQTLGTVNAATVFYAALTGVILWLSAIAGGWFDNWAVYHRLPQALGDHRLGQRFGRTYMSRFGGVVSRNMAAWGTNVSLGLLLGLTPVIGMFLGWHLDVRQVTLSSGMLALACASLDYGIGAGWFILAFASVVTMFVLNLSVSFFLSLYTAARAYELERRELAVFGMRLLRRLMSRPLDFVLPTKMEPESGDSTERAPGKVGRS